MVRYNRGILGQSSAGTMPSRRANRGRRRSLMWRIEDVERELGTPELDTLTRTNLTYRLGQLKDQLRRLGGPVEDEGYPY